MKEYLDYLLKNNLKKEYDYVNKICKVGAIPLSHNWKKGGKLESPKSNLHKKYRDTFLNFYNINKGFNGGAGLKYSMGENIKLNIIPFDQVDQKDFTSEEIHSELLKLGKFLVNDLNIDPKMKGYYMPPKIKTIEEKTDEMVLQKLDKSTFKIRSLDLEEITPKMIQVKNGEYKEVYDSNLDYLDNLLKDRPVITDLISLNIEFVPLNKKDNTFYDVIASALSVDGEIYDGELIAQKIGEKAIKDNPDFKEFISSNYKNLFNINIIRICESLFNCKIILIKKGDFIKLTDESNIKSFKNPPLLKTLPKSTNVLGKRSDQKDWLYENYETNTRVLKDTSKLLENNFYASLFSEKGKLNSAKSETQREIINSKAIKGKNEYVSVLPYHGYAVRDGMMICHNFLSSNGFTTANPEYYIIILYINDKTFQLVKINSKTKIDAQNLPYSIRKFIIQSCNYFESARDILSTMIAKK